MSDKYAAIAAERGHFPVRLMCAALGVSVRGFYDAQTRAPRARVAKNERLSVTVRAMFRKYRNRYGAPRVHRELRASGISEARRHSSLDYVSPVQYEQDRFAHSARAA